MVACMCALCVSSIPGSGGGFVSLVAQNSLSLCPKGFLVTQSEGSRVLQQWILLSSQPSILISICWAWALSMCDDAYVTTTLYALPIVAFERCCKNYRAQGVASLNMLLKVSKCWKVSFRPSCNLFHNLFATPQQCFVCYKKHNIFRHAVCSYFHWLVDIFRIVKVRKRN